MDNAKYIRTKYNEIIVFSALIKHSAFESFDPISAGFISFGVDENQNKTCICYGESVSLVLKSHPHDTYLAKKQILNL